MFIMRKSAFTTVFLIAILLTGAIATASVSMIDTEASSDKRDKKKDRDHERDYDKKDKERDHERDYDKKDKERDHDDNKRYDDDYRDYKSQRDYEDYEDDKYHKYDGKDKDKEDYYYKDKDNYYPKEPNKYYYDYDKHPKKLYKAYPKQYSESYDVKSHKKIKIIDCNNLNVNADELADLKKLEPRIKEAIASNNVEDEEQQQLASYSEYGQNSPYTRVYYIEPDTKVIFKCTNDNHNLVSNEVADEVDTTTEESPIGISAAENNNISVTNATENNATESIETSQSGNTTESIETSQSGNVTSDTDSTMQSSPSIPSSDEPTVQTSEVPFIFPIPRTVG